NRFGTPRRVALALGLRDNLGRDDVLDYWRSIAEKGSLVEEPNPPAFADDSHTVAEAPGRQGVDQAEWKAYPRSVMLERALQQAGVPNVVAVWLPAQGSALAMAIVAIKQSHGGHAMQALTIAGQAGDGEEERRFIVVVDEDIDVFSMNDVLWALLTRCDPIRDMTLIRETPVRSQLLIDATKPWEWKDRFAETITDGSAERAALERWGWILDPHAPDPRHSPT